MDAFPSSRGHALLIPKAHGFRTVMDMDAATAANVLRELPRLARAVQAATNADGVNILQNNEKAAGQEVFHAHFHVIPRFDGDNVLKCPSSSKAMITKEDADSVLAEIQKHI